MAQKVVKVGLSQINNPTPMGLKYFFRAIAFLSGVWAMVPQELLHITDDQYGFINKWIILVNAIVVFGIKFFGLEDKFPRY